MRVRWGLRPGPAAVACVVVLVWVSWCLTLGEAVRALEGRVSRSTLERAIAAAELPARRGRGRAGKACWVVEHADLVRWYEGRNGAGGPGADGQGGARPGRGADGSAGAVAADDDGDDDDDDVLTTWSAVSAAGRLESLFAGLQRAGLAEVGRQVGPLQERLEGAAHRLGRAEGERDALRMRALAAEEEVRRLRARVEALERELARRERGWLRRVLRG